MEIDPARHGPRGGRGRGAARLRCSRALLLALLLLLPGVAVADDEPEEEQPPARALFGGRGLTPRFELHGFANVDAVGERVDVAGGGKQSGGAFALGELDLFIVSKLSDSLSFLGETVFELDDEGETKVDVERLILRYARSDRFWVSFGRHHAALGYWNNAYHHGFYLQPTIERPEALKFEDDGGLLPIHGVGLATGGKLFRDAWTLEYRANVSNGRGLTPDHVQGAGDLNDNKALGLKLALVRDGKSFLSFGPMLHADRIPPDPGTPGREAAIEEAIAGAHFVYRDSRIEVLSEFYKLRHEDQLTEQKYRHRAYFAIAVWRAWSIQPYAGYDRAEVDSADPFFAELDLDVRRYLAGVRLDPYPSVAVKFELRHERRSMEEADVVAAQLAFSF